MPRIKHEFIKIEQRLFNDYRWFTLSESDQLIYIKLLSLAKQTKNRIPKKWGVVKNYFRTNRSATEVKLAVYKIKKRFPKLKENKWFMYFEGFDERHNIRGLLGETILEPNRNTEEEEEKERELNGTLKLIIDDLNAVLGSEYRNDSENTKKLVKVRLKEGFGLEDFKVVHRKMHTKWSKDEKMCPYLRPITLYSNKFESYLNLPKPKKETGFDD